MVQEAKTVLTDEVKAMIGVTGDVVECWGVVNKEYLRRFAQAVMDPDPRYWDEDFARSTKFGEIVAPPIMVSYMPSRLPPWEPDNIVEAFRRDPVSDGSGGVRRPGRLPEIPTHLRRRLNAGNEVEVLKYPSLGDKIFFQNKYVDIRERVGRDGNPFLLTTQETRFSNQKGETLCITRQSGIIR